MLNRGSSDVKTKVDESTYPRKIRGQGLPPFKLILPFDHKISPDVLRLTNGGGLKLGTVFRELATIREGVKLLPF